jgi:uncharacterized protein (TIGR02466 family)
MTQIHKIFPKVVYQVDDICLNHLDDFKEQILKLQTNTKRSPTLNVDSSHTTLQTIHRINPFNVLSNTVLYYAKKFMFSYGYADDRLNDVCVSQMWFNISTKGDFLFPHIHQGAFISGAYYVETAPDNHIVFYDGTKNIYEEPAILTEYSQQFFSVDCVPGRLILFHGDLHHGTPAQESEGRKIVISFNAVLKNN